MRIGNRERVAPGKKKLPKRAGRRQRRPRTEKTSKKEGGSDRNEGEITGFLPQGGGFSQGSKGGKKTQGGEGKRKRGVAPFAGKRGDFQTTKV